MPGDQLPTYHYSNAGVAISCLPFPQTTDVQRNTHTDLQQTIEIKEEIPDIPEPIIAVKKEPFDDEEMDRVLLNQISTISDYKYSPMNQHQYDSSSSDFEFNDEFSNTSAQACFGSINDIVEYLEHDPFNQ